VIFLHKSDYIVENQQEIIDVLYKAADDFETSFGHRRLTKSYWMYNIFAISSPDFHMYAIYKEIQTLVRKEVGDQPLWIQAWLNLHRPEDVLSWHTHFSKWHGYVSIDPKKTKTVFRNYEINNEIGNIYFGPGESQHMVEVLEDYDGRRITIGFDVTDNPSEYTATGAQVKLGWIPL
jgi:hypothetical protein